MSALTVVTMGMTVSVVETFNIHMMRIFVTVPRAASTIMSMLIR